MNTFKSHTTMSRIKTLAGMAAVALTVLQPLAGHAQAPLIQTKYTADPAPMVHNDTIFLYTTHDEDDDDGFKLFNANDTELLKGHNVYTVLSQMSYLHGSSFAAAKERFARTGSCYSNAVLDGTEYFYDLKQMENAQWTLAFLVPAEYVAVNTQKLVNIVMVIIIVS